MSIDNGKYLIVSASAETGHLDFTPYMVPIYPPIYFIVGSVRKDLNEQWKVTSQGGNEYAITSTSHPRASLATRGNTILASEGKQDSFSIEAAGDGYYRIQIPNEDQVATLEVAGKDQLHVTGWQGLDTQRWKFQKID